MNKAWLALLLLLPLCTAQLYQIDCYGEDFLTVRNQLLHCRSKVPQACYKKDNGDKGCITLEYCQKTEYKCCYKDRCNA
ncbi:hypothetical protein GJAV_G00240850 [Gymnothorax javanicus]|nr:hypothetical protein GJAV_G00240850 [Gymnothorax javanicus]